MCKECFKHDVRTNRASKREQYSEYERRRFKLPERKARVAASLKRHKAKYPERAAARQAVGNALRSGKLVRCNCEVCGDVRAQAHHEDYAKPLDVRWLCFKCHREHGHEQVVVSEFRERKHVA